MSSVDLVATIVGVFFTSQACLSMKLPSVSPPIQGQPPQLSNEDLQTHPMYRAAHAALQLRDILRNHTVHITNSTGDSIYVSSKKAGTTTARPIFEHDGYSNAQMEIRDVQDILPFLVDYILNPLIKYVLVNRNLYTYFGGSTNETVPNASPAQPVYENKATLLNNNPKPPMTPAAVQGVPGTVELNKNSGRDLLEENGNENGNPGKEKYRIRNPGSKTTATTTTSTSTTTTRKPYVADEDDEGDSAFLTRIKRV